MRIEIALRLLLDSPVSIGSGALADSTADKPIVKLADGSPVIPGSAIKGKTRHASEQIARALYGNQWKWPGCAPPRALCQRDDLCPVCRVFGTPSTRSLLKFSDLRLTANPTVVKMPENEWRHLARRTELRAGVSLSRALRTAQENRLFSVETFHPAEAVSFTGSIRGTVENRMEVALLLAALTFTRSVGGGKTRGLGWGRLEAAVKIEGELASNEDVLKEIDQWPH